jgi:hypothetical protein
MRAMNHAFVLSHSRVEDTIAGLCPALLCSALPHLSSRVMLEISFQKRLAVPCLAGSGFAPFAGPPIAHPSPSCAPSCSLVLPRARPPPSLPLFHHNNSLIPYHSHPQKTASTPVFTHPPSTVHQSTVAGRQSFLSALLFSSSTCAGLSASRYCRCWRHRHPPSAQRQSTRELLL